ncbi:MAG: serine hydrolase [Clostridia bacterium]|nr:serine hydrolase [Clostridia bacterium]
MLDQRLKTRIENFISRLEREDVCMHGFMLSVGGEVKAKAYYAPFEEGKPHRMYSISKSMTALGIGILIDEGKLSLDDHIVDYFQDYLPENPDGRLMRLTIRDMLRMATCYRSTAYREGVDENWTKPFFTAKPTHEPGTVFHYDTGCSQVLAALVARLSGKEIIDFLNERVFGPIGADDEKFWLRDPSGTCQGGTGLCMSLRDMHKVTRLIMEGGRGLIPRWFCEEMGKNHIINALNATREEGYGYGWQVWMTRAGWAMYGLGGQLAVVCPAKDVLLCTIADTRLDPVGVQRIYDAFFDEVYPYIGLEDMAPAEFKLSTHPVGHDPAITREHAGPYCFEEPNPLGLRSVELQGNMLLWENAWGRNELRFGVGENIVDTFPGWPQLPTLSSGGWIEDDLLRVRCFIIGNAPCGVDMLLRFKGDSLTVQSRKSFDPATNAYEGVASGYLKK